MGKIIDIFIVHTGVGGMSCINGRTKFVETFVNKKRNVPTNITIKENDFSVYCFDKV